MKLIVIVFNIKVVYYMNQNLTSVDNLRQLAAIFKSIISNQLPEVFVSSANIGHETWTMTLDDDSELTKEVVTWTLPS